MTVVGSLEETFLKVVKIKNNEFFGMGDDVRLCLKTALRYSIFKF
jgi:hypothetical protein